VRRQHDLEQRSGHVSEVKVGYRAWFNEDDLSPFATVDVSISERHSSGEEFDEVLAMKGAR